MLELLDVLGGACRLCNTMTGDCSLRNNESGAFSKSCKDRRGFRVQLRCTVYDGVDSLFTTYVVHIYLGYGLQ